MWKREIQTLHGWKLTVNQFGDIITAFKKVNVKTVKIQLKLILTVYSHLDIRCGYVWAMLRITKDDILLKLFTIEPL